MSTTHAFHDSNLEGLFIDTDHGLFFVPDEELNRVGYNPVQCGLCPISDSVLSDFLAQDYDGWLYFNLKRLGYLKP